MSFAYAVKSKYWPCKIYSTNDCVNISSAFNDDLTFKIKYKVNIYDKRTSGEWILEKQTDADFHHFLYNGKLYHLLFDTNTLLPLNMNFESEICGRCYEVVMEVREAV